MEIKHQTHRHGGTIERITAIQHGTLRGHAFWEFVGDVSWSDGGVTFGAHISPVCVCHDGDNAEAHAESLAVFDKLNDYLRRNGEWTRNGNGWKPHAKKGREVLE